MEQDSLVTVNARALATCRSMNKIHLSSRSQKYARCAYLQVKEMREQMLKAETLRFHTAIRLIAEESGAASDEARSIRRLEAGYVL